MQNLWFRNHALYHITYRNHWLDQGMKEIFEKVPDGEAITWCSPPVVQSKLKFTEIKSEELESRMIRASINMRIPNQSMKPSRCVQSPRVEDFIYSLQDSKIFTKLDLRQGYHQLPLDPSTRQVAAFSTPWEITDRNNWCLEWNFHKMSLTKPCSESLGTYNYTPLVKPERWHTVLLGRREILKTVLKRARDHRITFDREKIPVWSGTNWVLQTGFHQGWTEVITWQSKSSQREWSAWEQRGKEQRGSTK